MTTPKHNTGLFFECTLINLVKVGLVLASLSVLANLIATKKYNYWKRTNHVEVINWTVLNKIDKLQNLKLEVRSDKKQTSFI